MFGRRNDRQDMQIPYEVYETVQEPTARRRRWAVRLIAALIVVTLLVFGGTALQRVLTDDAPAQDGQANDQPAGTQEETPQRVDQPQSTPPASTPEPSPQPAGDVNSGTVGKPE